MVEELAGCRPAGFGDDSSVLADGGSVVVCVAEVETATRIA